MIFFWVGFFVFFECLLVMLLSVFFYGVFCRVDFVLKVSKILIGCIWILVIFLLFFCWFFCDVFLFFLDVIEIEVGESVFFCCWSNFRSLFFLFDMFEVVFVFVRFVFFCGCKRFVWMFCFMESFIDLLVMDYIVVFILEGFLKFVE